MEIGSKRSLLIVDDEKNMREVLTDLLEENGYQVNAVSDGHSMWQVLQEQKIDLVILDLRLQQENGLFLAKQVRAQSHIPIMMLTGKGDETDRILGLELVADDYLMKPFNNRELLARINALIRRSTQLSRPIRNTIDTPHECYQFGYWILDITARELKNESSTTIDLTFVEFNLLETLVKSPNQVFSRDQLLERTRSSESEVFDRAVDVSILRLRRKIEANPRFPKFIKTERGVGYYFAGPVTTIV